MRKTYKASDLITDGVLVIGDGYRAKNSELSSTGVPFARAGNIDGGFLFKGADCFPFSTLNKVGEKISQVGDVVFTSKGTVGRFAYVNESVPQFVYSPQLCFWRSKNQEIIQSRYLYYWMQSKEFIFQMNAVKGQTDMADYVSLSDQRKMKITVPSIKVQSAISHILGSIDDKIELNRQMNETLEQMAMALFTYWFMDGGIEQDIPIGNVEDFARIIGGGTPKTTVEEYWGGEIPWVSVKDLSNLFVYTTEKTITEKGLQESSTKLIPKRSTIISARGTIGELSITGRPMTMNQSCYAFHSEKYPYFTYLSLKSSIDTLKQNSHGSVFNTITKETIQSLEIPFEPDVCFQFEEIVEPWFSQIDSNTREIVTLTETRDYLLPRLLSGEIEVKVVEEQVEEVLAGG